MADPEVPPPIQSRPDPRPEPRWGQYADVVPVVPAVPAAAPAVPVPSTDSPTSAPGAATAAVRAPASDALLTTLLLAIGVFDVVRQFGSFAAFAELMTTVYRDMGIGEFTSTSLANTVGLVMNVARIALIVAATVWSARRVTQGKRAFWVPLAAGGVAVVLIFVAVLVVMLVDPAMSAYVTSVAG
jgi:hypothetical protein